MFWIVESLNPENSGFRGTGNPGFGHRADRCIRACVRPGGCGADDAAAATRRILAEELGEAILRPPTQAAETAKLSPEEMVIGVVAAGKARAYRLSAFEGKSGHLVNDMIGARAGVGCLLQFDQMREGLYRPRKFHALNDPLRSAERSTMRWILNSPGYWITRNWATARSPAVIPCHTLTPLTLSRHGRNGPNNILTRMSIWVNPHVLKPMPQRFPNAAEPQSVVGWVERCSAS